MASSAPSSSSPSVVVVMPTYNERANLEAMVQRLLGLRIAGLVLLVIDDNSPDGTGQIADDLAQRSPGVVSVIHRPSKMGLGTAYVAGFRWALEHGAQYIIAIDADFSHPPEIVPIFLEKVQGCDVVVGSRYVEGGSLDRSWGLRRRLLSWGGNFFARSIAGLPVRDVTGGFRCFRREALVGIDFESMKSEGFAFQVELAYLCHRRGFRVVETPIHFMERTRGESKMSWRIVWEAFWRVLELRLRE